METGNFSLGYLGRFICSKWGLCLFQEVFMLHLSNLIFTELLAENDSLSAETMSKMQAFVEKTNYTTRLRSAVWPPF